MLNAVKLSVATFCAVLLSGCASQPNTDSGSVQNVTFAQARACRVIDTFKVDNRASPDDDYERGATRVAQARAIEKGGDAILIQSSSITPALVTGTPSVMTLSGQILICHPNVASK